MSDILVEFEKYISSNKDVLSVLPINTKKNKSKYVEKTEEFLDVAQKIRDVIWNEIQSRYDKILGIEQNPRISELENEIENINNIDLFNELNTPYEKLGIDKITNSLSSFFEGDLNLFNSNIKAFIEIFDDYGIELGVSDFNYSQYTTQYMTVFFEETEDGNIESDNLKKTFEKIYWKCPDIVVHIELNMKYLYHKYSKRFEKELNYRNSKILESMNLDKNGLVKKYFDVNQELLKVQRTDGKRILDKFINEEWKIKDYGEKEISVVYDRLCTKDYFKCNPDEQEELNKNFGKLLNTLQEYNTYIKYKYILDDIKKRYNAKNNYKEEFDKKSKELRKKEQELIKENIKNKRMLKLSKNPFLIFIRKKMERKIYEFPVASNTKIKELKLLYTELENGTVNTRIQEFVDDNCTLKYMFKIAISFYTYAYGLVKDKFKDDPDVDVDEELQGLIDFIDQPYKVMLNNIKFAEEADIKSIIANRYKILYINLDKENLDDENIDSLIEDVEKIVNYHNIHKCGIPVEDIEFIERVKPMIAKMNKK